MADHVGSVVVLGGVARWRRGDLVCLPAGVGLVNGGEVLLDALDPARVVEVAWPVGSQGHDYVQLFGELGWRDLCERAGDGADGLFPGGRPPTLDPATSGPLVRLAVLAGLAELAPELDSEDLLLDQMQALVAAGRVAEARAAAQHSARHLARLARFCAAQSRAAADRPGTLRGLDFSPVAAEVLAAIETTTELLGAQWWPGEDMPAVLEALRALALTRWEESLRAFLLHSAQYAMLLAADSQPPAHTTSDRLGQECEEVTYPLAPRAVPARVVANGRPAQRLIHARRALGQSVAQVWIGAHPDLLAARTSADDVVAVVYDADTGAILDEEPVELNGEHLTAQVYLAGRTLSEVTIALQRAGSRAQVMAGDLVMAERYLFAAWWTSRRTAADRAVGVDPGTEAETAAHEYLLAAREHLNAWLRSSGGTGQTSAPHATARAGAWREGTPLAGSAVGGEPGGTAGGEPGAVNRPALAELLAAVRRQLDDQDWGGRGAGMGTEGSGGSGAGGSGSGGSGPAMQNLGEGGGGNGT